MEHFEAEGSRLTWRGDGETLVVEPWGADSARVRVTREGRVTDDDWALLPPPSSDATVDIDGARAVLRNGEIQVVLTASTSIDEAVGHRVFRCRITVQDASGRTVLEEIGTGGALRRQARHWHALAGGAWRARASFVSDPAERLVGMGMYQEEELDLKGCVLELAHRNSQASVPFVISSAGYGFLWHNPAVGRVAFGRNRTEWEAEQTHQLDWWITVGKTPAQILRTYADATGRAPMMPDHGLGFWQSRLRYWNQRQLLEVAREHVRRELPLDVIVADFFHWPRMGDFRFEDEFWPDPQAMVDELRGLGVELMVSVWPQVSVESENFAAMRHDNMLLSAHHGSDVQMSFEGPSMFVDVTNPSARQFLWNACRRGYASHGVRLFWLDEAEPELGVYDWTAYRSQAGPLAQVGNVYPQLFARAIFDGLRQEGHEQVVSLVRCAWAGSQRYGALVWSGDVGSTFTDMRRQIAAGLQMGLAGIPWFTTDIGGFHGGDGSDPACRELFVRWFQFGTFSPVMRLHGDRSPAEVPTAADGSPRRHTGAANEVWSFGEDVLAIATTYLRMRERLRPYVRELMRQAHVDGLPPMRAMLLEFPDDPTCWTVADQYMFGPDLLVAPVTSPGARSRSVYLPPGARWTDLHTGVSYSGGQRVDLPAPLAVVPLLGRDGAHAGLVLPSGDL
jgi:alpha-D-xyloside xylohydrolase